MAKYLTDRHEIARAMNFGEYPVVRINLETPQPGWDDAFVGDRVMVYNGPERKDAIRCTIHKFSDEPNRYTLMPDTICLQQEFGYNDVSEMCSWAQAPMIYPGKELVVIEDYPNARRCKVHMMRVSKCAGKFVYPTCYLEEVE